jgi:hypothetical protein
MKRLTLASCAALLLLAPVLALAQNRTPPAGSTTVGTAAPRGGETSTSSPSSSGSASERGGSSMGSGSTGSGSPSSSPANISMGRYDGPRSGESAGVARPRNASAGVGQPVPASERPRGDRPVYGYAMPRTSAKPEQNNGITNSGYYYPGYYGYPYYGYSYYGYSYYGDWYPYDPYMWWAGLGPMYGFGMYALPMSQYSSYWYDYYGAPGASYVEPNNGSIKLKVKPNDADVYVDGYFEGRVDNFDGVFQHLDLRGGTHRIEIRANGYQPIEFQVQVLPGRTITYSGELKPAAVK